jgi:hypothetical protein
VTAADAESSTAIHVDVSATMRIVRIILRLTILLIKRKKRTMMKKKKKVTMITLGMDDHLC